MWSRSIVASLWLGAYGYEIVPEANRHVFCSMRGCLTSHVISGANVLFCGGCDSYPSTQELLRFASVPSAQRLVSFTSSDMKTSAKTVSLKSSKFGPSVTRTMADQCSFKMNGMVQMSSGARTKVDQLMFLPIEGYVGVQKVTLQSGRVLSNSALTEAAHFDVTFAPNDLLKQAATLGDKKAGLFSNKKKAFIVARASYTRQLGPLDQPLATGETAVQRIIPGVSTARITAGHEGEDDEGLQLLTYSTTGLNRKPINGITWLLLCEGLPGGQGGGQSLAAIKDYPGFKEVETLARDLIARVWPAQVKRLYPQKDPAQVRQDVINIRNSVFSKASQITAQRLLELNQRKTDISNECLPQALGLINTITTAIQQQSK
ncbi:hypothetical protein GNI_150770 [Gregarina niphandrodes]|uniref:Uncharacterized protein n=1 Tax=Gregarina niphandrodes TaxID=110365 RepID=A0A023AZM0_GRENI|nr:hypothetical protein GNI_150770 [Gregarina niphandrodes]EZG44199.1 hypothetical protein GNI_150770 [Gregarina niphandrodes]|eukprot:XP_011132767.1 hypothetical protein GNI_150770 [Gregarina niphandrodes]